MNSCTWKPKAQLLLGQVGQGDLSHHDPLVAHAHVHALGFEPATFPELAQGLGDHLGFLDLAVLHGTGGQHLSGLDHGGRIAPVSSTARTAVEPMSRPMRPLATSPLHLDGTLLEEALQLGLADAVALADADGGELAALDQAVDRHVRHAHAGGDLRDREQRPGHERLHVGHTASSVTSVHTSSQQSQKRQQCC